MIVHNAWYLAAWADEITDKPIPRRICNEPVVLYRTLEDQAIALQDSCCHRGAPLEIIRVRVKFSFNPCNNYFFYYDPKYY